MKNKHFFEKYDAGTITKLKIFALYAQAWFPVFLSRDDPFYKEVHVFDFFSGPGMDTAETHGSPLRILSELKKFKNLNGWGKVKITIHFFDEDEDNIKQLSGTLQSPQWAIPNVKIVTEAIPFRDALKKNNSILKNRNFAKLLIMDQYGVDEITDDVFKEIVSFPTSDFIFFISSQTLHRFRNHPSIKIKIGEIGSSYDVHRATFDYFHELAPKNFFLSKFSIRKKSNIYGLIFGSGHPLGIHKFLEVAWENDEIRGEANFDIDRDNISSNELTFDFIAPKKQEVFKLDLENAFRQKQFHTELDIIHFCINAGMTCQHATPVIQKLKTNGFLKCNFQTPSIRNIKAPRPISYV